MVKSVNSLGQAIERLERVQEDIDAIIETIEESRRKNVLRLAQVRAELAAIRKGLKATAGSDTEGAS